MKKKPETTVPVVKVDDSPLPSLQDNKKPKKELMPENLRGMIMVKKSPIYRTWKGVTLDSVSHLNSNEIVAVDPKDKRVQVMLKNGNLQFVSNQIRKTPTGKYPRILEE